MPWSLRRYQQEGHLHFITFSCDNRAPLLGPPKRRLFEQALERMRMKYRFLIFGYVVMPEHVHLLVTEPEHVILATAIQGMKQSVSRKVGRPFWEPRYH